MHTIVLNETNKCIKKTIKILFLNQIIDLNKANISDIKQSNMNYSNLFLHNSIIITVQKEIINCTGNSK